MTESAETLKTEAITTINDRSIRGNTIVIGDLITGGAEMGVIGWRVCSMRQGVGQSVTQINIYIWAKHINL